MIEDSGDDKRMSSAPLPELLSIVALPIGNIEDLTLRAISCLQNADVIFCEDTRKTSDLIRRAKLQTHAKLISSPGDSEHAVDWMRYCTPQYRRWVLVSDAGTPVVNDPGVSIISFCHKHQIRVEALPGASAPVVAWQWSGGFGLPFIFGGFAPKVSLSATSKWERFVPRQSEGTFCFFDTRHQILETLSYLNSVAPNSQMFVAREMTKTHEELLKGTPHELHKIISALIESDKVGELCVLIDLSSLNSAQVESHLASAISYEDLLKFRKSSTKEASKFLSKWCDVNSRDAYKRLVEDEND